MPNKIKEKIIWMIVGFSLISITIVGISNITYAACGRYFCNYNIPGYFYGKSATPGQMKSVLPKNASTGLAIPDNRANNMVDFIKFLQEKNSSGITQNKTGSAFIVCLLLQEKTYSGCINKGYINGLAITPSGWSEIDKRLNKNPKITANFREWASRTANFTNSAYDSSNKDTYIYTRGVNESGWSIRFYIDGSPVFTMFRACANPIDGVPGIPPVLQNWSLTPYVSLNPTNYVEAGSSFNITSYINNTGEVASSNVTYNLEKKVGNGAYATYSPYSGTRTFPLGTTYVTNNLSFSDTDYDAGTQICFRLSVTPRSNTNPATLSSTEDCIIIGKKPKVQIWGGDLWVRGNIQTSSSVKSGKIYGSWDEYGLFAGGNITGMASGSAFNGGLTSTLSNTCNYSTLTFSNTQSSSATTCKNGDNLGQYDTVSRLIPDVAASFPTSSAIGSVSGTVTLGGLSSGIYKSGLNDITINGATLPSKKWIVLNVPSKNVTINGNITYTPNTLHKLNDIPQLVIIAKSITINSNVTNVDAWLIAYNKTTKDGFIKTCNSVGDTIDKCNQKLTINGPVMTDKLYLYRTAGSGAGADSGVPAEVINLRADAYLWAYNRISGRGKIQTVYTKELPPRF